MTVSFLYSIGSNNQGFEFNENIDPDKIKIVFFPIRKQQKSIGKAKRDLMMKVIDHLSEDNADLKAYFAKNYQY